MSGGGSVRLEPSLDADRPTLFAGAMGRPRKAALKRNRRPRLSVVALLTVATGWLACVATPPGRAPEVSDADRERFVRRRLQDSRALLAEGRTEHAEGHLRRGLAILPENPDLHRALARLLEETGRTEEAVDHRLRANSLDPVAPLPNRPIAPTPQPLLVVLVPSDDVRARPGAIDADFVSRGAIDTLRDRLRVRLPGAMFVQSDLASTADARRWLERYTARAVLSLRLDRAFCGASIKDGPFSVSWLRVSAQTAGRPATLPTTVRADISDPELLRCHALALQTAFESALQEAAVVSLVNAPGAAAARVPHNPSRWSRESIRALFPAIESRIREHIESGRLRLKAGEIGSAVEAFQRAVHVDPEDPYARAYLNEAETTLAMVRELAARRTARSGNNAATVEIDSIDPRLSAQQAAAAEAMLADERRRRTELLAALAVLDEDLQMPAERLLETLRPVAIRDPQAFGPSEASRRAGGAVEARAAYAPDGSVLARYYYATEGELPLVREEDTNGDGEADRWIGYTGRHRAEIWEDGGGHGVPDRRFVFASGGTPLLRIEIDADANARHERVFHYAGGVLEGEDRDTDGDGLLDRFDRFDAQGNVVQRAEDLNRDGEIDVRDSYRNGKLVRREIIDPDVAAEALTRPSRTPM